MSKVVQFRRGTTAEHAAFTGAAGEVTVDTDKKVVVVHDGVTAGGIPAATGEQGAKADAALQATAIAPAYSAASTYALGAICTYLGTRYKCTTAITVAEAWTAGHWAEEPVQTVLDEHDSQLADVVSDVQRIDNALAPLSLNIDSWKSVQQALRAGLAPKVFPIGTQFLMSHSVYGDRLYDVVAHDYLKSVHDPNAHTMTLMSHDLLPGTQFDSPEAFFYATTALAAGTYNFTLATAYSQWAAGTYQFTLANELPVGGQLTINGYADAAMTTRKVYAFSSRTITTKTEECVITSGSEGTSLGTFGTELNHPQRVSYGSNNYKESAIRQFLNSSAAAGSVWTPQTKFDRPPSWVTSLAGFVGGLDADFLSIIGDVVLPCATNSIYEAPDSTTPVNTKYNLHDKFYLASRNEVFGSQDGVADDSVLFPYYTDATNADRIKYLNGSAAYWWVRTPYAGDAFSVRLVISDGTVSYSDAGNALALAPACTIV